MRFTFDGTEYRLGFSQFTETHEIPGIGPTKQRSTAVRIRTGERDKDEKLVAYAKVTQFYKDRFNFEIGRETALRNALSDWGPLLEDKEFRKAAWNAYHSREGGLFQKKAQAGLQRIAVQILKDVQQHNHVLNSASRIVTAEAGV